MKINIVDIILILSLFCLNIGCTPSDNAVIGKKNLLFILTDEQRYDTSAPYGNQLIKTPNLNKLGNEGIVFKQAYVTQPVCSPARSSLLTGLYPHSNGVISNNIPLDEKIKTLPELINDTAYRTAYIGKWHLGREVDAWHGFTQRISIEDGYTINDTTKNSDYREWLLELGYQPDAKNRTFSRTFASNLPFKHSKTKFIEDNAIDFLIQNKDKPFILYLAFLEPHSPNNGPFNDLHDPADVDLDSTYFMNTSKEMPLRYFMKKGYSYDDSTQMVFAKYWGLVHQVDKSVGNVLDQLKSLGLEGNTIVVFTSEHGKMMRKFGLTGKTVMYEPSSRIPWMMYVPGMEPKTINQRVSQIDMVPTLLELLNQPIPKGLQGKSLLPLVSGTISSNAPIFMEWNPFPNWQNQTKNCPEWAEEEDCIKAVQTQIRTVVTQDGWKLNWSSSDISQLFNLNVDPLEVQNLYHEESNEDKVNELKQLILEWQVKTDDKVIFQ